MHNLVNFVQQGGSIAYGLIFINIVGYSIMLWKILVIARFTRSTRMELPRTMLAHLLAFNTDRHIIVETIRTEIALAFAPLHRGLTTVENIATIAPLLGLLGTVLGIFDAFGVIAEQGLDDPASFAAGIKLALVTTVLGLIVAIPHVLGFNYLNATLENAQDSLENEVLTLLGKSLSDRKQVV